MSAQNEVKNDTDTTQTVIVSEPQVVVTEKTTEENKGNEPVVLSSKKDIHREDVLRKVFSAVLLMMSGMLVLQKIRNRKEKHHE